MKLKFDNLLKASETAKAENEFNKTLFIPKKDMVYKIKLDLNEIEQNTLKTKDGSKEYTAYLFKVVVDEEHEKNWRVMSKDYNKILLLINTFKPTTPEMEVEVCTNDKGYVSSIELYDKVKAVDNVTIEDIDDDVLSN